MHVYWSSKSHAPIQEVWHDTAKHHAYTQLKNALCLTSAFKTRFKMEDVDSGYLNNPERKRVYPDHSLNTRVCIRTMQFRFHVYVLMPNSKKNQVQTERECENLNQTPYTILSFPPIDLFYPPILPHKVRVVVSTISAPQ